MKKALGILGVFMVFWSVLACESKLREVQKSVYAEFTPSGDADSIHVKYTDSGRIKSVLESPKMLDYATVKYPYTEFPKGVRVTLYDNKGVPTFVTAKYAVSFKDTELFDLQGNVKISNTAGQVFETEQLYFDQKNEWFFTERRYKFTDPKGVSYGEGVDFSKDLKIINSQRVSGALDKTE